MNDKFDSSKIKLDVASFGIKNKFNLPEIKSLQPKSNLFNYSTVTEELNKDLEESRKGIEEFNRKKNEREVQNNENLKKIVDYNSEITEYNKQLVDLNKSILTKINSVNTSLDFILEAIKQDGIEHNALLLELITIMDSKDKGKLKEFLGGFSTEIAVGLVIEGIKFRLGIS